MKTILIIILMGQPNGFGAFSGSPSIQQIEFDSHAQCKIAQKKIIQATSKYTISSITECINK